jgi:hypothetical protein
MNDEIVHYQFQIKPGGVSTTVDGGFMIKILLGRNEREAVNKLLEMDETNSEGALFQSATMLAKTNPFDLL